jgi:hypothetical protein
MAFKLRAGALVFAALIATSGVMASAAQAGEFKAEAYPVTIEGSQTTKHTFKFEAGTINCAVATFDGTLEAAAKALTVTAEYSQCATPGGAEVIVEMKSCDYDFLAGETLENDKVDGVLNVKCAEAGDEIRFEEPANGCVVGIPAQKGLSKLTYTDKTMAKDFEVDIGITEMEYTQNANCAGGAGVFNNGTYTGKSTMKGEGAVGVTVI